MSLKEKTVPVARDAVCQVAVPCLPFRLRVRVDAAEELSPLTIVILKCADRGEDVEKLCRGICLPAPLVWEEIRYLTRLGMLRVEQGRPELGEAGRMKLDLFKEVAAFNEAQNTVYAESQNASIVGGISNEPHRQALPQLMTNRQVLRRLRDDEGLVGIAQRMGLPDWANGGEEVGQVFAGTVTVVPEPIDSGTKWVSALLDLDGLGRYIQAPAPEKGPHVVMSCTVSYTLISLSDSIPRWLIVTHFDGSSVLADREPVTRHAEEDIHLCCPELLSDEQAREAVGRAVADLATQYGLELTSLRAGPVITLETVFRVPVKELTRRTRMEGAE